jgi:ABC-type multidrug transport system ATPase subunit
MKLQRLHIKGFRNIDDLDLDLSSQNGLSVLIGNNGSGKSNILEAVVAIFASLYSKAARFKIDFEYDLEYILDGHKIEIKDSGRSSFVDSIKIKNNLLKNHLPKNIIASYSGETSRLEDGFFTPFRNAYVRKRLSAHAATQRMWFINKEMWNISLLSLFLHSFDEYKDIKDFCEGLLGIQNIEKIKFRLAPWRLTHNNEAKQLLNAIMPEYAIERELTFAEFKTVIDSIGFSPKEVFQALYIGIYANAFPHIDIIVRNHIGSIFSATLLSEGEKKLLSIFTMLEVLGDEKSLMLYDEPDSHIHISRKGEINKLVKKYSNRQHIITTHSPTLAKTFFDPQEHLNYLAKDDDGNVTRIKKDKCDLIAELTENIWNISDQNTFLASTKPMTLLVEGKTDKIHIEEAFRRLRGDYPELDFDVFSMNSSEHIREVLIGLSCSEIQWNKKFIGIFDNDQAGQRDIGNGFEKENGKEQIKHVKYKDGIASNNFYAFLLPVANGYDKKDGFTIENCYSPDKYEQAVVQAVSDKQGHFAGLSIDKIADDIKNKSKTLLANSCKSFADNDFEGFKPIFDIIEEIRQL